MYGTNHGNHVDVTCFVDLDYAIDPDKGRSITVYILLVQRCVISWKATLQHVVALSTIEVEYMARTEAVNEAIWLWGLLEELGVEFNTVAINCDNQGAINLSRNHVFHERTQHINVQYHFIREVLEAKTVNVLKVCTEHNVADAFTKVVPGLKLQHCLELINVGMFVPILVGKNDLDPIPHLFYADDAIFIGIAPVAIIDRQLSLEYTIASGSTNVMVMAHPAQNINHSAFWSMFEREKRSENNFNDMFRQLKLVLRVEKKMFVIEQPIPPAPAANSEANVLAK
nr:retrovirus-related Pol polyprotein from transposon TNT 1-94 [Tanacetum cinerariifolium]